MASPRAIDSSRERRGGAQRKFASHGWVEGHAHALPAGELECDRARLEKARAPLVLRGESSSSNLPIWSAGTSCFSLCLVSARFAAIIS
jgi:hypothetical protein